MTDPTPAPAIPDEAVELFCRVVGISDNRVREGLAAAMPLLTKDRPLSAALAAEQEIRKDERAKVAATVLELADEWYPGEPGPRRMDSWGQLAREKCARRLRDAVSPDGVEAFKARIKAQALREFLDYMKPAFDYWQNTSAGEDFLVRVGRWMEAHPDLAAAIEGRA